MDYFKKKEIIINIYNKLTKDCEINNLGPPFTYYYSNMLDTNLVTYNLIDIDIKSAFPTICKIMFGPNHQFVKNIYNIENKLERNKYLMITLKELKEKNNFEYINEINIFCKMLILSYIYSKYSNINILEYIKDGVVIDSDKLNINENPGLIEFIENNEITFHEKNIEIYLRFNDTSIFKYENDNNLKIKGKYHNLPLYIKETIYLFVSGEIYNKNILNNIINIYNINTFNIYYYSGMRDLLEYYYMFNDKKYLNEKGNLDNINNISVRTYLIEIIYPILALLRFSIK